MHYIAVDRQQALGLGSGVTILYSDIYMWRQTPLENGNTGINLFNHALENLDKWSARMESLHINLKLRSSANFCAF